MHKIIIIAIAAIFSMSSAVAMSDKDICQMRAELMGAMAIERDKGKTKTQVKALINKNMKQKLPKSFDIYIDAVFEFKEASPNKMKEISLYSCYQEFGLL